MISRRCHHMVPHRVGFLPAGIGPWLGSGEVAEWTFGLIDLLRAHHSSN